MATTDLSIRIENSGMRTPENGWFRFQIGEMEATIVSDGRMLPHSIADFFPDIPAGDMEACKANAGVDGSHFSMEQNCLVLRYQDHVVLFDTGVGSDLVYSWDHSGILLRSMVSAGIDPSEVTEVVLTHAHCDHAWGMVNAEGAANFPKAQVFVSRLDFDYWTDTSKLAQGGYLADSIMGARRNLLPYADRTVLIESDVEILPGIVAVATPGHSPGHISYIIGSGPDRYMFLGDVAHTSHLQMANPSWSCAYDFDKQQAAETRGQMLKRAVAEDMGLIGYHFTFPGVGKIVRDGLAYRFSPLKFD